jgi:hypothetical protein
MDQPVAVVVAAAVPVFVFRHLVPSIYNELLGLGI